MPHNSTGATPPTPITTAADLHTRPTPSDPAGCANPTGRAEPPSPTTTSADVGTRIRPIGRNPTGRVGRAKPPASTATATAADIRTRTRPTPSDPGSRVDPTDGGDPTDCGDPSDGVEPTGPTGLTDRAATADRAAPAARAATAEHPAPTADPGRAGRVDRAGRVGRGGSAEGRERIGRGDRGAVTAELALALPVLVSLLLLGIWSIGLVVLNIRCIDAARDVARAVARGETPEQAKAIGHRTVPHGTITITRNASDIHVTVTAVPTHKPPLLNLLTPAQVAATATLQAEPQAP